MKQVYLDVLGAGVGDPHDDTHPGGVVAEVDTFGNLQRTDTQAGDEWSGSTSA